MFVKILFSSLLAMCLTIPATGDEPASPPAKAEPTKAVFLLSGLH